jgi:nucleoside 2-deoxyribosyltransferase
MNDIVKPGSPVYCAGPMFSIADQHEESQIAHHLEDAGFSTYLPQRDGIEVGKVMGKINSGLGLAPNEVAEVMTFVRKLVFALDMYQLIGRSRAVVFNMDGRVPDEGGVAETATAFAAGQPIVIFKTSPITILGGTDNPMVQGLTSNWSYVDDLTQLPDAVTAAVATKTRLNGAAFVPGPHLRAVLDLGSAVWNMIDQIHASSNDTAEQLYKDVQALESALGPLVEKADDGV